MGCARVAIFNARHSGPAELSSLRKKKLLNPLFPALADLRASQEPIGRLDLLEGRLVGARAGVVRSLTRFLKDPSEPEWPRIYRAELSNSRYRIEGDDIFSVGSGKGLDDASARVSALGEAIERYSGGLWPEGDVMRARRADVSGPTLDPRRLVLYAPEQYQHLPYQPYDENALLGWVEGRSLASGEPVSVPAMAALMSYAVLPGELSLCQVSSNGLAAGPTRADAALRAVLEVLERDAFMSTWLLRLPAEKVDAASHPDERVRALVEAYRRRKVAFELYRLVTDHPVAVFAGLGVSTDAAAKPTAVVGLGADFDPAAAARSALLEIAQVRPALRYKLRDPEIEQRRRKLIEQPNEVETLDDHDLRYAGPETLSAFDFLRGRPVTKPDWSPHSPCAPAHQRLELVAHHLVRDGSELICVDLTTPDMAALGLYTARAIVPDYQPIFFGQKEMRLAHGRLARLRARAASIAETEPLVLNPDPHPLA
jgi:ribosomal protein S12 methylthiotransferase accessory factor